MKLIGIDWICVRDNPSNWSYGKYKIEFKSNIKGDFSFRDSDQSKTYVLDGFTDRVANGDIYRKSVTVVGNEHAIGYNSDNPKIVEVGRAKKITQSSPRGP